MDRECNRHDGGTGRVVHRVRPLLRWAFVFLLLSLPTWSLALSLFDVVELSRAGYSDKQIIELIEKTRSRFQVDASAVIKLKEAGVSEEVIKELVRASATDSLSSGPGRSSASQSADPQETHLTREHEPDADPVLETHDPLQTNGPFSSFPAEEIGSGHADSHQHYAIAIRGVNVFILRSEAAHRNTAGRAKDITARLNRAVDEHPFGVFYATPGPNATVWYRQYDTDEPIRILTAGKSDMIGYQQRSLGEVSEGRVAAYWPERCRTHRTQVRPQDDHPLR